MPLRQLLWRKWENMLNYVTSLIVAILYINANSPPDWRAHQEFLFKLSRGLVNKMIFFFLFEHSKVEVMYFQTKELGFNEADILLLNRSGIIKNTDITLKKIPIWLFHT